MSSHESVSCDSCMKANFKGRRYKCLICYDYDLCATCYEAGVTTGRHSTDHAVQCILTRADFELYYGGDSISSDHAQSFTCPYCGNMGYSEVTLLEHVTAQHCDSSSEVICPVCAALPGGDPNMVSDDFQDHLAMEHRGRGGLFEAEMPGMHRAQRRLAQTARRGGRSRPTTTSSSGMLREPMDPIAELLSHLSGVHNRMRGTPQQLREIQMQLEAERHAIRIPPEYREQLQRFPRRAAGMLYEPMAHSSSSSNETSRSSATAAAAQAAALTSSQSKSSTLLSKYLTVEKLAGQDLEAREKTKAEQSLFIQEVVLATLTDARLSIAEETDSASGSTLSSNSPLDNPTNESNESDKQ